MCLANLFSILCGISFMACAIYCAIGISNEEMDKHSHWLVLTFSVIGTLLLVTGAVLLVDLKNPTALDVYQGKTTLEITYRDSVAVDSVVVFKTEEE